jgi:hypothetical protein
LQSGAGGHSGGKKLGIGADQHVPGIRQRGDWDGIAEPATLLAKRGSRTRVTGSVGSERFPFLAVDPALAKDAHKQTPANILRVRIRDAQFPAASLHWKLYQFKHKHQNGQ